MLDGSSVAVLKDNGRRITGLSDRFISEPAECQGYWENTTWILVFSVCVFTYFRADANIVLISLCLPGIKKYVVGLIIKTSSDASIVGVSKPNFSI